MITPPTSSGRPPLLGDHFLLDMRVVSQKRDYCSKWAGGYYNKVMINNELNEYLVYI